MCKAVLSEKSGYDKYKVIKSNIFTASDETLQLHVKVYLNQKQCHSL